MPHGSAAADRNAKRSGQVSGKFRFVEQSIVGWGHDPTNALTGLGVWFFAETCRFATIFTAQFSNLVGGVMTPPYGGVSLTARQIEILRTGVCT